jgi:hypothetical protein
MKLITKIKLALLFLAGMWYASSFWYGALCHYEILPPPGAFLALLTALTVLLGTIVIVMLVADTLIDHWDDDK